MTLLRTKLKWLGLGVSNTVSSTISCKLCMQASIESLTVSSVGTTISNGLWGLDRIDQQSRKRDYMYHYSSIGTGVHVYTVDTVSHQSSMYTCSQFCSCTQHLMSHTCLSHSCRHRSLLSIQSVTSYANLSHACLRHSKS